MRIYNYLKKIAANISVPRWITWHFFPKPANIPILSVFEVLFYAFVFIMCVSLFIDWNYIQHHTIMINLEKIPDETQDSVIFDSTSTSNRPIPIESNWADAKVTIPMILNPAQLKNSDTKIVSNHHFHSEHNSWLIDSILSRGIGDVSIFVGTQFDLRFRITPSYDLRKEFHSVLYKPIDQNIISTANYLFSKDVLTNDYKGNVFYFNVFTSSTTHNINFADTTWSTTLSEPIMPIRYRKYQIQNNGVEGVNISEICAFNKNSYDWLVGASSAISGLFNNFSLQSPKWLSRYDISQAYYQLQYNTSTIDSTRIVIDFIGATEFSSMDPEPDVIGMSQIEFNNQLKILKIRKNGLKFHVIFKELENKQSVRLFAITALMSGLIIIFLSFLILALYKVGRKFRKQSKQR